MSISFLLGGEAGFERPLRPEYASILSLEDLSATEDDDVTGSRLISRDRESRFRSIDRYDYLTNEFNLETKNRKWRSLW